MANCVTCKARCEYAGQHRVKTDCISYMPKDYPKPQTNYDLLISKTPEELAKMIVEIADCDECEEMHGFRMCDAAPGKSCEDCWAGWLKSPVEVDE